MTLTELVIGGLAAWEIYEIWHHSLIMASRRSSIEARGDWFSDVAGCGFCFSPWCGWLLALLLVTLGRWSPVTCFLIYGLAIARLANLGNDLTHHRCRTPRHNREDTACTGRDFQKVVFEFSTTAPSHDSANSAGPDDGSETSDV
jgi:hypothetical protein